MLSEFLCNSSKIFISRHRRRRALQISLQQFVLSLLNFLRVLLICNFPYSLSLYSSQRYQKVGISPFFNSYYRFQNPDLSAHEPSLAFGTTLIWVLKCFKETGVSKFVNFCRMTNGVASIAEI